MFSRLFNKRVHGLLLLSLAVAGFGATTLLLSFSLMNTESFDPVVSPRTLIEKQELLHASESGSREIRNDGPSWRAKLRRNRGGAKRASMLKSHQKEEAGQVMPTRNRTIDTPCPDNAKPSFSDTIPSHCAGYSLPFTTMNVPKECWPRVFLLPSYPTSGNELVHVMFQRLTGLISFNSFPLGKAAYDLSTPNHAGLTMSYDETELCFGNSTLSIPVAGQVALSKNHYRHQAGGPNPHLFHSSQEQQDGTLPGNIAGVVRLARNPGDHLLRNFFRWDHRDCHDDSCFYQQAKSSTCHILEQHAYDWNQFHNYWDNYNANVPQMVMHYEEFSHQTTAVHVFDKLMQFVKADHVAVDTIQKHVKDFVREPTYQQGGLVATICGVKVARRVHRQTAEYSARLGYEFDNDSGTWSLSTERTSILVDLNYENRQ